MKQLSIIILAFAAFWLAGCTVEETNNDNPVNKDGNARLKVTFSNGVQSRAIGNPFAAELEEKTINKLSFYVYPAKEADKEMVPFQRYVFDMTTMPLTQDSVSIVYANSTDASGGYTCDFILREGAGFECTIVAIANAPDNFDRTNNLDTYAKLQQAYVDCETMPNTPEADLTGSNRTDKYGLAMYAEDTKMIKKALTTNIAFNMERLAARIDISNAAYEEAEANGFVLQSARIINGKHTSYVIPATVEPWTHPGLTTNFEAITSNANPNAFRLATKTGKVSNGNTTDADPSMEDGKVEQRLWHALYTYENDDEKDATATSVEIKGLFRGAPFSRILPFVNYDKNPVIIQRNHRYLVRLNPAASLTDITYNITVAEWNAVDTINVKPTQKEVPTLTYTTPGFAPDASKTLEVYNKNAVFTLDAVCQFDTQYKVVPEVGEPAGTDVSWVTVNASEPEVVTRTTGYKRTYTVTATDLPSDNKPRQAMLLIANGANFTARDTVHIKQVLAEQKPVITYTNEHKPDGGGTIQFKSTRLENISFTLDAACLADTRCEVVSGSGVSIVQGDPDGNAERKRTYTITLDIFRNGDVRRDISLRIYNDCNPKVYETVKIKHVFHYPETTIEPIWFANLYWAPVNAGATQLTPSISSYDPETCGYLHQWGKQHGQRYGGEPGDVEKGMNWTYFGVNHWTTFFKGDPNHQGSWFIDNKAPNLSPALHVGDRGWPRKNQPCPEGWRVPYASELKKIADANPRVTNGVAIVITPKGFNMYLPAAGYRYPFDGTSRSPASANYWSSTLTGSGYSPRLAILPDNVLLNDEQLGYGFSIRCIQE